MTRHKISRMQKSASNDDGIFCDTEGYVQEINNVQLCGLSNWRVPASHELKRIVHCSNGYLISSTDSAVESLCKSGSEMPSIEKDYFPNTVIEEYWTSTLYVESIGIVSFSSGYEDNRSRENSAPVRLVSDPNS